MALVIPEDPARAVEGVARANTSETVTIELRVVVEMTDQQIHEYAEEFCLEESEVVGDVRQSLTEDLASEAMSLFWTAVVK